MHMMKEMKDDCPQMLNVLHKMARLNKKPN